MSQIFLNVILERTRSPPHNLLATDFTFVGLKSNCHINASRRKEFSDRWRMMVTNAVILPRFKPANIFELSLCKGNLYLRKSQSSS